MHTRHRPSAPSALPQWLNGCLPHKLLTPADLVQFATTEQLRQSGFTPAQLRSSGTLYGRGLHQHGSQPALVPAWATEDWHLCAEMGRALHALFPRAAVVGLSAAALYGLPVRPPRTLDVGIRNGESRPRREWTAVRTRAHLPSILTGGLRIAPLPAVLREITARLDLLPAVQCLDAVLGTWHGPPALSLAELNTLFAHGSRSRHQPRRLAALALAREGVGSPQETRVRLVLRRAGLPEPEVSVPARLSQLGTTVHVDLGYAALQIGIEYEGQQHRTSEHQFRRDIERYNALAHEGWLIIRVTKEMSDGQIIDLVAEALATRRG